MNIAIFHWNYDLFTQYHFLKEKRCHKMTFSWRLESERTRARGKRNHKFRALYILYICTVLACKSCQFWSEFMKDSRSISMSSVTSWCKPDDFGILKEFLWELFHRIVVQSYDGATEEWSGLSVVHWLLILLILSLLTILDTPRLKKDYCNNQLQMKAGMDFHSSFLYM